MRRWKRNTEVHEPEMILGAAKPTRLRSSRPTRSRTASDTEAAPSRRWRRRAPRPRADRRTAARRRCATFPRATGRSLSRRPRPARTSLPNWRLPARPVRRPPAPMFPQTAALRMRPQSTRAPRCVRRRIRSAIPRGGYVRHPGFAPASRRRRFSASSQPPGDPNEPPRQARRAADAVAPRSPPAR